jgi:hypothetical protein
MAEMEKFREKVGRQERRSTEQSLVSSCLKEAGWFQKRRRLAFAYSFAISMKLAGPRDFRNDDVR